MAAFAPDAGQSTADLAGSFPAQERAMAKAIRAKTTEVAASNVSMVSQPEAIARTIKQAVRSN